MSGAGKSNCEQKVIETPIVARTVLELLSAPCSFELVV